MEAPSSRSPQQPASSPVARRYPLLDPCVQTPVSAALQQVSGRSRRSTHPPARVNVGGRFSWTAKRVGKTRPSGFLVVGTSRRVNKAKTGIVSGICKKVQRWDVSKLVGAASVAASLQRTSVPRTSLARQAGSQASLRPVWSEGARPRSPVALLEMDPLRTTPVSFFTFVSVSHNLEGWRRGGGTAVPDASPLT